MNHPCRRFTLLEMIIVVMVILILVSMLMPSFFRARHLSNRVLCFSNLKQQHTGLYLFSLNNQNRLPRNPSNPSYTYGLLGGLYMDWKIGYSPLWQPLNSYGIDETSKVWRCPSDVKGSTSQKWHGTYDIPNAGARYYGQHGASYLWNKAMLGDVLSVEKKLSSLRNPGHCPLSYDYPAHDVFLNYDRHTQHPDPRWSFHEDGVSPPYSSLTRNPSSFFDGHVELIRFLPNTWDCPDYTLNDVAP